MKMTLLTATLILAFASSAALASDKETKDTKGAKASTTVTVKKKTTAEPKRDVALTGSNIKRVVRKDGQVTDGPNSLTIIDSKAIERSGAADVRQVLARQSSFR
jgi:hypothetical protein